MVATQVSDVRTERATPAATYDSWDETKLSLKTTELWAFVLTVIGVLYAAYEANNFAADQAWTLVAVLTVGYMISRGLAKAGSRHHIED
jgi:hypothetical protein